MLTCTPAMMKWQIQAEHGGLQKHFSGWHMSQKDCFCVLVWTTCIWFLHIQSYAHSANPTTKSSMTAALCSPAMIARRLAWTPMGPMRPAKPLKAYIRCPRRKTWKPLPFNRRPTSLTSASGSASDRQVPCAWTLSAVLWNRHLQAIVNLHHVSCPHLAMPLTSRSPESGPTKLSSGIATCELWPLHMICHKRQCRMPQIQRGLQSKHL